ncbi:MAG: hypothetical protein IPM50_02755 [Acidobacteriota bacterium]|nr:MAG: hypothetical protein IPM50_02755 [Acidobacteriota bacterium]
MTDIFDRLFLIIFLALSFSGFMGLWIGYFLGQITAAGRSPVRGDDACEDEL